MISRTSVMTLAELYQNVFAGQTYQSYLRRYTFQLRYNELHDFLYQRDHEPWLLNIVQGHNHKVYGIITLERALPNFIMQLHTGVSVFNDEWTWAQRTAYGQQLCLKLASDILNALDTNLLTMRKFDPTTEYKILLLAKKLQSQLELDGYILKDGKLYASEATVVNIDEELGLIGRMVKDTELEHREIIDQHLELSGTHFAEGRWSDSISNTRNFLEAVLREIADRYAVVAHGKKLAPKIYSKPVEVRQYLEQAKLLTADEAVALAKVYGLLSGTGSHPYIAVHDQARLMRNLGLMFAEFALLRFAGYLQSKTL